LALLIAAAWFYWNLTRPADLTSEGESGEGDHLFSIYGFEGDLLRRPSAVGIGPNGDIYVADTGKHRIVVFDSDGAYRTVYGEAGDEPLQIQNPIDVAVADDGRSYVLDKNAKKIVLFDPTNQPSGVIPFDQEISPLSLTVDDDTLFVTTESGIVMFDLEGNPLTGYVAWGKEPGQFDKPGGVAVGEDGTLYVADSFNYRVQAISTQGEPLWQYGTPIPADQAIGFNEESRLFGLPASIAVDEEGFIYVVDGTNSEVIVLTTDGEYQETIGGVGHDDGLFYYPDGIEYNDGTIVIADKFNDRVEVFRTPAASSVFSVARFLPLLLPLLLLPLLLLLRRRTKYVVNADFVERMHGDPAGAEMAKALKRAFAAPEIVALGEGYTDLDIDWRAVDVDEEELARLRSTYGLDEVSSESLAAATSVRGKRVLLTDVEPLRKAATELEVPTLTYEELRDELVKETPPAGGEGTGGSEVA
jgi:sugar lactone lactonase YvrE